MLLSASTMCFAIGRNSSMMKSLMARLELSVFVHFRIVILLSLLVEL